MHRCLVKEIKLLQNELHECEESLKKPEEFRVYVVHKVALEMLSNRPHQNVSTFHSNAWGTRSGGAATDALDMRMHAAEINRIQLCSEPCTLRHRGSS